MTWTRTRILTTIPIDLNPTDHQQGTAKQIPGPQLEGGGTQEGEDGSQTTEEGSLNLTSLRCGERKYDFHPLHHGRSKTVSVSHICV